VALALLDGPPTTFHRGGADWQVRVAGLKLIARVRRELTDFTGANPSIGRHWLPSTQRSDGRPVAQGKFGRPAEWSAEIP
jgi:hypothetical protein